MSIQSSPEAAAATRFAADTTKHTMTIVHDDGVYRHLVFRDPRHPYYWFELITTPGQLVFSGDGDSFVFRRLTDMFQFFRTGLNRDGSVGINPVYWSEKLASNRDAARTYSVKLFDEEIVRELEAVEGDYPGVGEAWIEHVESGYTTEYEDEARRALDDFRFGESYRARCIKCDWSLDDESPTVARRRMTEHTAQAGKEHTGRVEDLTFTFNDVSEWQLQDFDWWFLWALHGIVHGIARYDRLRSYGLMALATPSQREAGAL
ncbi:MULTISPECIES: hypothetical protein [unclassified Streptomyces]|uniref:hypothetical protein n=1 Tax=unclassified Streptomyces TaxID=2593676 RepID=UPI000A51F3B3|nr:MULTISPECIES: hypothetical protein [unclassified Streptomyces]